MPQREAAAAMAWRRSIFASILRLEGPVCAGVAIGLAAMSLAQEAPLPEPSAGERLPAPENGPELLQAPAGETDIAIEPEEGETVLSPDQPGNIRDRRRRLRRGPGGGGGPGARSQPGRQSPPAARLKSRAGSPNTR